MSRRADDRDPSSRLPERHDSAGRVARILSLQSLAGNQAVAGVVQRNGDKKAPVTSHTGGTGAAAATGGAGVAVAGPATTSATKAAGASGTKAPEPTPPGTAPPAAPAAVVIVLNADAKLADAAHLAVFKARVKTIVEQYGFTFVATAVSIKQSSIVLDWDPAWGSVPATTPMPDSLSPLDARLAVAAAKALPGWAKLSGGDQGILEALLSGETNDLSGAARHSFATKLAGLKALTPEAQATALKALMAVRPGVVAEEVSTKPAGYKVGTPSVEKDYQFQGVKADAEVREIVFDDGVTLKLIAPKGPTPGLHNHTVEQTAKSASYVPKSARAVINTIMLNPNTNPDDAYWAVQYKDPNFHSYMTAGKSGVVTIYPDKSATPLPSDNYMRGTMVHETGHTWSYKTWGTDTTKGRWVDWKAAMDKDKLSVSTYATNAIAEDVAETIQVYGTTKGTARFDQYRKMVPNRFAILDKDYK